VVKLVDFGALVSIFGKRHGLVHVSQIASKRLNHPNEFLKEGQEVKVKLPGFDGRGKVRLGMKMVDQGSDGETGRSWGTRTHDPRFWRPMLYQLS
jgi:polyribonucleotide nucleotidyltransferase